MYSIRLRAGRRRTYFFDIRPTKGDDFYLTITESKKRGMDDGYERHKIFLYKEDYLKFIAALEKTLDHMQNNLLPDYDFDEFNRDIEDEDIHESSGPERDGDDGGYETYESKPDPKAKAEPEPKAELETETESDTVSEPSEPEESDNESSDSDESEGKDEEVDRW